MIDLPMLDSLQQHRTLLGWLFGISMVTFLGTLVAIPWIVARIPADYFLHSRRDAGRWRQQHPAVAITARLIKNLVGLIFVLAGVAMLVLPGQGLLTILIGLMLIDFPGKRRFELALIRRKHVLRAVNWIRRRAARPPLQVDRIAKAGDD